MLFSFCIGVLITLSWEGKFEKVRVHERRAVILVR
jgi:hypothetical protein